MLTDFLNIFLCMAAGLSFLLAVHFLTKDQKQLPDKLLGIIMFLFSADLMFVYVQITDYWKTHPHLIGLTATVPYLYGPILYLFAKSISEKINRLRQIDYLHFLPFVIMNIWGLGNVYFRDAEYKFGLITNSTDEPIISILGMCIPVVGIIYVFFSSKVFYNYRKRIKENFSNIDQINMEWLRYFLIGNGVVWSFVILAYLVSENLPEWFRHNWLIYIPLSVFIFVIGYISLTRKSSYLVNSAEIIQETTPAYSRSGLTDSQADDIIERLYKIMQHEKPYKNSSLRLQDLSNSLNIPPHYLTEILNTRLKQNFYDYINKFRVDEVKSLIEQDRNKKYNLLNLALEAGFSSKSSFNSIFKKHTGLTPSQFRSERMSNPAV